MRGFWSEVGIFLQESWELFFWSLWCPSKLHNRLHTQPTQLNNIERNLKIDWHTLFLPPIKSRVRQQLILVLIILNLPQITFIMQESNDARLYFLFAAACVNYSVAKFFLPAAFVLPILSIQAYSNFKYNIIGVKSYIELSLSYYVNAIDFHEEVFYFYFLLLRELL